MKLIQKTSRLNSGALQCGDKHVCPSISGIATTAARKGAREGVQEERDSSFLSTFAGSARGYYESATCKRQHLPNEIV